MVKSIDGGSTWSAPLSISTLVEISPLADTAFRVNSYPAAAVAPNGDVYVTWTTAASGHSVAVYSTSTDGGMTWSAPVPIFAAGNRTADGYPVTQPTPDPDPNGCQAVNGCDGSTFNAPSPTGPIEDVFPAASVAANGDVYLGAYRGDYVSPWQTCFAGPPPPEGRINCTYLGPYIHNTRLDYFVQDVTTNTTNPVSTHPINTRYQFGGGFFGDYTDMASGSDNVFHAFWTDSNNVQNVVWWYGLEFVPTPIHQQDVVTGTGNF
jgi:hypothetical protein